MGVDHSGRKILERTKSLYKLCPERYLCDGRPPGLRESSSSRTQVPQQRLWGLRGCWQQVFFGGMMDGGDWKKKSSRVAGFLFLDLEVQTWYSQLWWCLQIYLGKLCVHSCTFYNCLVSLTFKVEKTGGSSPASSLIRRECENFRTIAKRSKTKQIFFHRSHSCSLLQNICLYSKDGSLPKATSD